MSVAAWIETLLQDETEMARYQHDVFFKAMQKPCRQAIMSAIVIIILRIIIMIIKKAVWLRM